MSDQATTFDFGNHLKGKTVLVAGASGGLGAAVAALAARDGAHVVCGYRNNAAAAEALQKRLRESYQAQVEVVGGDIATAEGRDAYLEAADGLGNGIYGLVCCTGNPGRVKFDQVEIEDLEASMTENYYGPILLAREAAKRMQRREVSGAIVFYSTMQATAPFESSVNYAGPKAALQLATRILAKQWGGAGGIRVNAVAPGVNRAGMALASIKSGKYDFFVDRGIVPRFGRPEDTARVVRLLLEPDNYITGQIITVDGGLTLRRDVL